MTPFLLFKSKTTREPLTPLTELSDNPPREGIPTGVGLEKGFSGMKACTIQSYLKQNGVASRRENKARRKPGERRPFLWDL